MKILAMYLPQFHKVKENDEWWGEGYTDWVSASNAVPLYEGHYQPHIPQNKYYYDLMEKSTFEWQTSLMKKYGIDGQCIYHYWFKDGRQILEKPIEKLLEWKEIDMPYCFCWANQSWANSWSGVKGANIWCDIREKKRGNHNESGLLLEQQYGDKREWRKHFDYLLPFFKDERYIKVENKPVFVLYQAMLITVLGEMSERWNAWAKAEGFAGIYFIGAGSRDTTLVDAVLYPGPQTSMSDMLAELEGSELKVLNYKDVWEKTLNKAYENENGTFGAFVGYDDTPRRGTRGCVIDGESAEIFKESFMELLAVNEAHGQIFTFINAWNEWGEGMHLEPDEKSGAAYLRAVCYSKMHYKEYLSKVKQIEEKFYKNQKKEISYYQNKVIRYEGYWKILDKWLLLKEKNKSIADLLEMRNIHTIILYGVGMLGKHVINDLYGSKIEIICAMDKSNLDGEFAFPVIGIDDDIPQADAILITPVYDFSNIKELLEKKGQSSIISLDDLFEKNF